MGCIYSHIPTHSGCALVRGCVCVCVCVCESQQRIPFGSLGVIQEPLLAVRGGSFGVISKAYWAAGCRVVAVKSNRSGCADPAAILRERDHLAMLSLHPHPNIVVGYGYCEDGPTAHRGISLVMEYCDTSLESFLAAHGGPAATKVHSHTRTLTHTHARTHLLNNKRTYLTQ